MEDNTDQILEWTSILGGLLMLEDIDDYPWSDRMHHGTLGMYLAGGVMAAKILKAISDASKALEEEV